MKGCIHLILIIILIGKENKYHSCYKVLNRKRNIFHHIFQLFDKLKRWLSTDAGKELINSIISIYISILMLIYIVFTTNNFFQPFVLWNQKTIKYDFSVTFFVWKKVCGRNTVACTYFHVKHWFRYHLCPAFRRLLVCVLSLSDLYWNDNKNKLWNKGSFLLFNAIFLYIALRNNPSS